MTPAESVPAEEPTEVSASEVAATHDLRTPALIGLTILSLLAVCTALWAAQIVFIPIVFALLVSYALDPVHRPLVKIGVPRTLAAFVIIAVAMGLVGGTVYGLRGQANAFVASLPEAASSIRAAIQHHSSGQPSAMSQVRRAAQEIEKASNSGTPPPTPPGVQRVQVESPTLDAESLLWKGTGSAMTLLGQAVVVIVLTFYFLASGDLYKRKLVHIVGTTLSEKRLTVEILNEIELQFGRYLVVRVEISLIVGVATWLAFWALGMPSPGVWGVAAGVLNVVPYLGPTAIASSSAVAGFLHTGTIAFAVTVGLTASAIAAAEGFILTPTLMGRAGRMNGVAVFIALTVWGFLWGICGLLLAVPITMAIKVICDHVAELQGVSELLGE